MRRSLLRRRVGGTARVGPASLPRRRARIAGRWTLVGSRAAAGSRGRPMTPAEQAALAARLPDLLADLEALVSCESPSADLAAVRRSADLIADIGARRLGIAPE